MAEQGTKGFEQLGEESGRALAAIGIRATSAYADDPEALKRAVEDWHAELKRRIAAFMDELRTSGATKDQIGAWATSCVKSYLEVADDVNRAAFAAMTAEGNA